MLDTFKPNPLCKSVAPLVSMAMVGSEFLAMVRMSVETTNERKRLKKG